MTAQERAEHLAELQKLGLKRLSADLSGQIGDFRRLLTQAHREAMLMPDEGERGAALHWSEVLMDGTVDIPSKLSVAIAERDPSKLYWAASNLGYVPRAASDQDFSWFSKAREFEDTLVHLLDTAAAITRSINTFDPASMESARKALS